MSPDVLAQLTQAIEDGHYPYKCEGALSVACGLRGPLAYDLLGILCDLSGLGTWEDMPRHQDDEDCCQARCFRLHEGEAFPDAYMPPWEVLDWAGIDWEERDILFLANDTPHDDGTIPTFADALAWYRGVSENGGMR